MWVIRPNGFSSLASGAVCDEVPAAAEEILEEVESDGRTFKLRGRAVPWEAPLVTKEQMLRGRAVPREAPLVTKDQLNPEVRRFAGMHPA